MSGGLEQPYTIAAVSKPLDSEHGRITATPVHSLSGSRKRKRREVAVGVDGESVSIYDIQNQSTLSSYSIPPQSYLAIAPTSIYVKSSKPLSPKRQTYLAVRDGISGDTARILSITEDLSKPNVEERELRAPTRRERKLRHGQVVGLDVIAADSESGAQQAVLASYLNGDVDCFSSDLSSAQLEHEAGDGGQIEYAATVDFQTARRGLLKGREDVSALLTSHIGEPLGDGVPPLLFQVVRLAGKRQVRAYALRNVLGNALQNFRPRMEEILSYDLPHAPGSKFAVYDLHPSSGMLYQLLGGSLTMFDLSGTVPRLSFELGRRGSPRVISFTRMSSATILVVSPGQISVYETRYGSVLSSLDYPSRSAGQKNWTIPAIVSQNPDLGLVVALSGTTLMAFHVGDMLDDGKGGKASGPLLTDVLAKPKFRNEIDSLALVKGSDKRRQKFNEWKENVDRFVEEGDVSSLESFIATDLSIQTSTQSAQPRATNGIDSGRTQDLLPWELLPQSYDSQHLPKAKPVYILGKIFAWRKPSALAGQTEHNLEVTLLSRNIMRWLAMAGYLTSEQVQRALPRSASGQEVERRVAPGYVMKAIADAESSFTLMCDLISLPVHWDLAEIVQGLQALIRSLDNNGLAVEHVPVDAAADEDTAMIDDEEEQNRLEAEVAAASLQLDAAQSMLESGLKSRSEACKLLLVRLQAFPQKQVTQAMHTMLTHDDIDFFISILRIELSDGGWTSRYIEQTTEEEVNPTGLGNAGDLSPSNVAIRTIANLFNCALDAVGLSGWLVGRSGDSATTEKLIGDLRNEVSAASEGLFEIRAIENMLHEVCRTAGALERQPVQQKRKREDVAAEEAMLPLAGRLAPPTLGAWGPKGTKRLTRAALAEEKNRNVGAYSFDRIRV